MSTTHAKPASSLNIQVLLTGNEIMSGDTVDSNSALIAHRLGELSLGIQRKVTVGDDVAMLTREMRAMAKEADVLIVNGGLGPTIDDLTAQILAAVAEVPLTEHPGAIEHLEAWCGKRGVALNAANRKQAMLPSGAIIIANPVGSAVGFEMTVYDCRIICTPGVPSELRPMLDLILESLSEQLGQPGQRHILRLQTFGMGESTAQQIIDDAGIDWPNTVELGFRAGAPQMEIKLTVDDGEALAQQQQCREHLERLFGDHIIGEGDISLAECVLALLAEQGATLTTAESCTGGLIASMLTRVPGASRSFETGFVTYADTAKTQLLDVDPETLRQYGAVSNEAVSAMARGALQRTGADYVIAVSGIAGPDGGTPEKPVGTVCLAWGSAEALNSRRLCWPVERSLFQTMVAAGALDALRRQLLGIAPQSTYFSQRSAE